MAAQQIDRDTLVGKLTEALNDHVFDNRFILHPRQFTAVAERLVDGMLEAVALDPGDSDFRALSANTGRELALAGVGTATLLSLLAVGAEAMGQQDTEPAATYRNQVIAAYIDSREDQISADQEQLRQALSDALAQQRQELYVKNHAIETTSSGAAITDVSGVVTYANPSLVAMLGVREPAELIGRTISDVLKSDPLSTILKEASRGGSWQREISVSHGGGVSHDIEVTITLISDRGGTLVGLMVICMDVTDRKRLERQFRQAQKLEALGQLASGIVHDVNNLLTAVGGFAELILMKTGEDDPTRPNVERIITAIDRGRGLTEQLRVFTRQRSSTHELIDLNTVVGETRDLIERTFPADIAIDMDLSNGLRPVAADLSQMGQVMMNLCVNARDAIVSSAGERPPLASAGGTISISTFNRDYDEREVASHIGAEPGEYACVRVTDTGGGMSREVLERIFDPFFTTKGDARGTGLGLAVVYGIVKNHSGFVDVRSSLGIGSVFDVCIPVAADHTETGRSRGRSAARRLVPGSGTVLVVDDEEDVRAMLQQTLELAGYDVAVARNGLEALVATTDRTVDLVLLDMIMPKMGGLEFLRRLEKRDGRPIVVVMTGYTADTPPDEIMGAGADAYLEKPLSPARVTEVLRNAIIRS